MLKTVINPPAELVRDEAAPVNSGADESSVELASSDPEGLEEPEPEPESLELELELESELESELDSESELPVEVGEADSD